MFVCFFAFIFFLKSKLVVWLFRVNFAGDIVAHYQIVGRKFKEGVGLGAFRICFPLMFFGGDRT